jgi:uncharacterized membrane protein YdjX (TVP38/TMEM64 family)
VSVDAKPEPAVSPGTPRTPVSAGTPRTPVSAGTPRTPVSAGTPRTPGELRAGRRAIAVRVLGALAVMTVPLFATQIPPVRQGIVDLVAAMRDGGVTGVLLFALAAAVGGVLAAPIALFSGMAGYVYGPVRGILIASPAVTLAATCGFLLGRFGLRRVLARRMARPGRWQSVERALAKDGLRIAVLLRLTPVVPQNFLSIALGAARVKLSTFVLATFLGLLPAVSVQVYVGSLVQDVAAIVDGTSGPVGPTRWVLSGLGLLASALALAWTARLARRALDRAVREEAAVVDDAPALARVPD